DSKHVALIEATPEAAVFSRPELLIVDRKGSLVRRLALPDIARPVGDAAVRWSPDDTRILLEYGDRVLVVDAIAPALIGSSPRTDVDMSWRADGRVVF